MQFINCLMLTHLSGSTHGLARATKEGSMRFFSPFPVWLGNCPIGNPQSFSACWERGWVKHALSLCRWVGGIGSAYTIPSGEGNGGCAQEKHTHTHTRTQLKVVQVLSHNIMLVVMYLYSDIGLSVGLFPILSFF